MYGLILTGYQWNRKTTRNLTRK